METKPKYSKPPKRASKPVILKSKDSDYDDRPTINLTETEIPEIKDWKIGEEYNLEVTVKMMGTRISSYGTDKGKVTSEFKVVSVKSEENEEK